MRKSSVWVLGLVEVCAVAACGGGGSAHPDAGAPRDSSSVDAPPIDASIGVTSPPPCGFTEAADASNAATAEASALAIGTIDQSLCGTINTDHFDPDTATVDIDSFGVSATGGGIVVRLFAAPGANAVGDLSVTIFDAQSSLVASATYRPDVSDHAATLAQLPAGDYTVTVTVHNPTAPTADFDYKIELAPDPDTRCPVIAGAASYAEAGDGLASTGNDVVAVTFSDPSPYALTAASDAAEPTGLTIDAVTPLKITGTSAAVDASDDYQDRDTYMIRTGPVTTELSLRLGWADAGNDLDFLVFPVDQVTSVGEGLQSLPALEYGIVPVKPDTAYWVWIGSHDGSTALPADYNLSLCGAGVVELFASHLGRGAGVRP